MQSPSFAAKEFQTAALLDEGERLLVIGCRMWVACITDRSCPLCPLEQVFDRFGIPDAAAALHDVLCTTARAATRPFQVHGPRCPQISEDEILLLRAAAFAQRRQFPAALRELQDWLPAAAAHSALGPLHELAVLLSEAGLTLPMTETQTSEDVSTHARMNGEIPCTVH
jgi:hypothetical protein